LRDWAFAHFDVPKQNLGFGRLIHFLMLGYVIAETPRLSLLAKTGLGEGLQRLGRHSLAVFALGSALSCVGQAMMRITEIQFSSSANVIGLLYTAFGTIGLFLFARYLEWNNTTERRLKVVEEIALAPRPVYSRASWSRRSAVERRR
jgi:hypothetical protein